MAEVKFEWVSDSEEEDQKSGVATFSFCKDEVTVHIDDFKSAQQLFLWMDRLYFAAKKDGKMQVKNQLEALVQQIKNSSY